MKISVGADHAGFELKNIVINILQDKGYQIIDKGTDYPTTCDYPDFAKGVIQDVVNSIGQYGILICNSGIGMSMIANKYQGIRAALCYNSQAALLAREHNNANVLCLGSQFIKKEDLKELLESFFEGEFNTNSRHANRLNKFDSLGEKKDKLYF